jgi:cell division protein FtsI/penicillin-binding protein 2
MRSTTCVLASASLVLAGLTGCQLGDDDDPQLDAAVDSLVAGLESGDLAGVPVRGDDPTPAYDDLTAALGPEPQVAVGDVEADGDTATATLRWTWDLPAEPWEYETTADLTRSGDEWQVAWAPQLVHPALQEGWTLDVDEVPADRGDILGARDSLLVTERDVVRLGLDKTKVAPGRVAASARSIAEVLGIDSAAYVERATQAGPKAFVEALVLRAGEARQALSPAWDRIAGAASVGAQLPLAPTREFASLLLGTVGEATAEIVDESDGAVLAGDQVGRSGLQARYDDTLRGRDGHRVEALDADGASTVLTEVAPVDGTDLRITLDPRMQTRAEDLLAGVPGVSALVAIRPSTGEVLAAANGPANDGLNAATYGRYAPGSTFKVVTALALLRSGLTPDSPVSCPATTVVDGKTFKNYDDYPSSSLGRVPLREAFAQSCNTAMIEASRELGDRGLADAAAALGLGVDHDLGFPAYFGQVPPPASDTERAADAIGQGKVLASPLAMAAVAASVQAGEAVLPRLVTDHEVDQQQPSEPLTAQEATRLRDLMRGVVTGGSGSVLAGIPGVRAKTGTAEFGEPDASGSLPTHAWMIAGRGDLAVAVFVERGESGSRTAGPVLRGFLAG